MPSSKDRILELQAENDSLRRTVEAHHRSDRERECYVHDLISCQYDRVQLLRAAINANLGPWAKPVLAVLDNPEPSVLSAAAKRRAVFENGEVDK